MQKVKHFTSSRGRGDHQIIRRFSSSLHVEMSLGEILSPKLLLMAAQSVSDCLWMSFYQVAFHFTEKPPAIGVHV